MELNPIQKRCLGVLRRNRGLLAFVGVGHGKTLISLLSRKATKARKPLLLYPASARGTFQEESLKWCVRLPETMSYETLSTKKAENFLQDYKPDLIVCDEVHYLKDKTSTRTSRVLRYMKHNPETVFAGLSGTVFVSSIKDFEHLLVFVNSSLLPLPESHLARERLDLQTTTKKVLFKQNPKVAKKLHHSLKKTPGIVFSTKSSVDVNLTFDLITGLEIPKEVTQAFEIVKDFWRLPMKDSDFINSAAHIKMLKKQILMGFHYYYHWPAGEVNEEWLEARLEWARACRDLVEHGRFYHRQYGRQTFDSPSGVIEALFDAEKYRRISALTKGFKAKMQVGRRALGRWRIAQTNPNVPEKRVKWISEYMLDFCENRSAGELIWNNFTALAEKANEREGLKVAAKGQVPRKTRHNHLVSVSSHGKGLNMQKFQRNLVLQGTPNPMIWEQLIGRTHRQGQRKNVHISVLAHHPLLLEDFKRAVKKSKNVSAILQQDHKLSYFRQ